MRSNGANDGARTRDHQIHNLAGALEYADLLGFLRVVTRLKCPETGGYVAKS